METQSFETNIINKYIDDSFDEKTIKNFNLVILLYLNQNISIP